MQRCDVLSDSRRRDLHYEESVGVEAIPLVLLAEWTYSKCAGFLDGNESDLKMRCHEQPS
jgi:hypothetical protein